ncbi:hypothetical protein [Nitrosopumilus sp. Nsub]|uniref:hypothetical protein n=1 Tax=Nitrosopumilus sp. Nsub TaxID=1776294 RepID=UPI00082C04CF|nr:hypothetical protein [Nitrosopumilus sp. Nsub]
MSWLIQCPKHGAIIEEYHFKALKKLKIHSTKKCEIIQDVAFLIEYKKHGICERIEEQLDSIELLDDMK